MGFLEIRLPAPGPLLTVAIVLIVGVGAGSLSKRARLPSMTGQLVAGVLLGIVMHRFVEGDPTTSLAPLTDFALGLIAVTVGSHLNFRRLRNAGRRLVFLLVAESTILPLLVYAAVTRVGDQPKQVGWLYAAIAIATAPATIVTLVKELRAKGVFVKTLIGAVALNNLACITLFEIARVYAATQLSRDLRPERALQPAMTILAALALGFGLAIAMRVSARVSIRAQRLATASFMAMMICVGVARSIHVSPLLACLALGLSHTNLVPDESQRVDAVFQNFEPVILSVFFTLAGVHLSLEHLRAAGVMMVVFVAARTFGKWLAGRLAMTLAGATKALRAHIGLALVPQAGVAVGLVLLVNEDPELASIKDLFGAVVLSAVTMHEIIGPILTRRSLAKSGEAGMDRSRLIDFIQEEHIVTDLSASTKEEAIVKLVDLLILSHHLERIDKQAFLDAVLEREAEVSTCIGGGLAVPHGELPEAKEMVGVMGISKAGLPFETPDGQPVHCVVLLGTPKAQRQRHLEVLAALARTIGTDPTIQAQLFAAKNAAYAYDVIHSKEAIDFNYFLKEA